MNVEMIFNSLIVLVFFICLIFIYFSCIKNKYLQYYIRINRVETVIEENLKNKFELLNRSIGIIKANASLEEDILEDIVKLRSRKLNNFDLDVRLKGALNEFNELRDKHHGPLNACIPFTKLYLELGIIEEKLLSTKSYYNNVVTKYDKLVKSFPSNLMGKCLKFKEKKLFDCDYVNDEIFNKFNI